MNPIPLMDPGGRVFTYACSLCFNYPTFEMVGGPEDQPPDAEYLEARREDAASCCTCSRCGAPAPPSNRHSFHTCHACGPGIEAEGAARRAAADAKDAELAALNEKSLTSCPDPNAARELLQLMSDLSEEAYCASWMTGIEFQLWEMLHGGERAYGNSVITLAELGQVRDLSGRCDGWWMWHEGLDGEIFIRLEPWRLVYSVGPAAARHLTKVASAE